MALSTGSRIGSYEVVSKLGEGGMGLVYRATDRKLGRDVALKILPEAFAGDPDRLARFEREAKALAALNHPNVAQLYGVEDSGTVRALVMELVEGETIADRLQHGPIPLETALAFAHQIADAVEAAHERGIIHRDLKPANVKITPDDKIKVLDFGLAKAMDVSDARPQGQQPAPSLATMTSPAMTAMGTILGTAAYMSPEQARGFAADHRSDIFSFGVVFFEMLTGRQPFKGDTISDVLASVLARDPDLGTLPGAINPRLTDLIRRCLDKSPKRRWQAIGDVRAEIEIIAAAPRVVPEAAAVAVAPVPLWKGVLPALGLALVAAAATGLIVWNSRPTPFSPIVTRFPVPLDKLDFRALTRTVLAISPDGTQLAFTAGEPPGIFMRGMNDVNIRPLRGSTDAASPPHGPVFSADGRSLAFWTNADQTLKRIPVEGGAATTICRTELPAGVSWTEDGLVYSNTEGVFRVPSSGGQPELILKATPQESVFGPQLLSGGYALLFTVAPSSGGGEKWERASIVIQPLPSGNRKIVVDGAADGRYVSDGVNEYVLFLRAGILYAVPFDAGRMQPAGREVPVIEGVRRGTGTIGSGSGYFSVSKTGALVYVPGPLSTQSSQMILAFFDRSGVAEPLGVPAGPFQQPRMSPDGKRVAFVSDDAKDSNVWIVDVGSKQAARRLTFGGRNTTPAWSHDSQRVAYQSDRDGDLGIFWQRADGTGAPERLITADKGADLKPLSFAPAGDLFLYESTVGGRTSLWQFAIKDRKAIMVAGIESTQLVGAVVSPDGKWLLYNTRDTGRTNVLYVEPFPRTGAKYQISDSSEDAHHAAWSQDGKEVFYTPGPGTRLIRVPIVTTPSFSSGPSTVMERPFTNFAGSVPRTFDMARDGKHFVVGLTESLKSAASAPQIQVVLNWFEELRSKVGK